jgi:hypothetical protein
MERCGASEFDGSAARSSTAPGPAAYDDNPGFAHMVTNILRSVGAPITQTMIEAASDIPSHVPLDVRPSGNEAVSSTQRRRGKPANGGTGSLAVSASQFDSVSLSPLDQGGALLLAATSAATQAPVDLYPLTATRAPALGPGSPPTDAGITQPPVSEPVAARAPVCGGDPGGPHGSQCSQWDLSASSGATAAEERTQAGTGAISSSATHEDVTARKDGECFFALHTAVRRAVEEANEFSDRGDLIARRLSI